MRIYNAKDSQICIPLNGSMRINIAPHSVSQDFLGATEFLTMLVTSYDTTEIALIVSGVYELGICANIPTCTNYVVQTLEEALARFNAVLIKDKEEVEEKKEVEEEKPEEPVVVEEKPAVEEAPKPKKKPGRKKKTE
jgi:hypothetical protein